MSLRRNPCCCGKRKCDTIRFVIGTFTPANRTAMCFISAVPEGCTIDDVVGRVLTDPVTGSGGMVYVADPIGCYFNEPSGELVGREGWARRMQPLEGGAGLTQEEGYEEPQWEVVSLCCDRPACD